MDTNVQPNQKNRARRRCTGSGFDPVSDVAMTPNGMAATAIAATMRRNAGLYRHDTGTT
ncbi:MAG: hypothetical protein Kow0010_12240 [Dehalococcoidia bacterium]